MILTLTPYRGLPGQPETTIAVNGDTLTVDGIAFDLSPVPEGGRAVAFGEHPFVAPIERQGGQIRATLRVCLDDTAEAHQPDDAARWTLLITGGPVTIPALRKPAPVQDEIPAENEAAE